jgi:cobalt-zinc-cadmium efflux system membrane fusion protein
MPPRGTTRRVVAWVVQLGFAVAAVAFLVFGISFLREKLAPASAAPPPASEPRSGGPRLAGPDTVRIEGDVVQSLGVRTARVQACRDDRSLAPLTGSLAFDNNHLVRVQSRFAGEVVEIGPAEQDATHRPLTYGDRVRDGQLLAVVLCKDLGEKKSELLDALSQYRLDRDTLQRLEELFKQGGVPESRLREARRSVEADRIAVSRAERILRTWQLSEKEIDEVRRESERLARPGATADPGMDRKWARVEVRARMAGTVLERNVNLGDIVDTTRELFKIGDLRRLKVWAHAYEEDLPRLLALARPVRWQVQLKSNPAAAPVAGTVEHISEVVDVSQHTVLVMGDVENPGGLLRAGQFITARVDVPPADDKLELPTSALVEDGQESVVFVQAKPAEPEYRLCPVKVLSRDRDRVIVAAPAGAAADAASLKPGAWVVTSGAVELRTLLESLAAGAAGERP